MSEAETATGYVIMIELDIKFLPLKYLIYSKPALKILLATI